MEKYYNEFRDDRDICYSIDNIILHGKFSWLIGKNEDGLHNWVSSVLHNLNINANYWANTGTGVYRNNWRVETKKGGSFYVGIGYKGQTGATNTSSFKIDANPNKVGKTLEFHDILKQFMDVCERMNVARYDLAFDIQSQRSSCFLVKDQRMYQEVSHSLEDRTQYLGRKSHAGYVKLYNKQIESDLSRPMTRLELTMDGNERSIEDVEKTMPSVWIIRDLQTTFSSLKMTDMDRFTLNALLDDPTRITQLGRKMKKRMETFITEHMYLFKPDKNCVESTIGTLRNYEKENTTDEVFVKMTSGY